MTTAVRYYTDEERARIGTGPIPAHIAMIMDGNRRWAKAQAASTEAGHSRGADTLMTTVKAAKELGVKVATGYAFSTENWDRPEAEVEILMALIENYLRDQTPDMVESNVHFATIGDLTRFPESVRAQVQRTKEATAHCNEITLVLALNYGGRSEIVRAMRRLVDAKGGEPVKPEEITEERVSSYLDTAAWPDPDLLIRTSGEMRISNFLLWQLSYSELYMTETLWPDFSPKHLLEAIAAFQDRERRLGR